MYGPMWVFETRIDVGARWRRQREIVGGEQAQTDRRADQGTQWDAVRDDRILAIASELVAQLTELSKELFGFHRTSYEVGVGPVEAETNLIPSCI